MTATKRSTNSSNTPRTTKKRLAEVQTWPMFRKRAHAAPRLILNALGAYTTDTAYRITPKTADAAQLVAAFVNPLTALSAELEGRGYGGGVLELVPSEIEKLLVPLPQTPLDLPALDAAVRARSHADVLAREGSAPLHALGFEASDVATLLDGWLTLHHRRCRTNAETGAHCRRRRSRGRP